MTTTNWIGTGSWNDSSKWDNGIPDSTIDAVISGGGNITLGTPGPVFKSVTFEGYRGTISDPDGDDWHAWGDCFFPAGLRWTGSGGVILEFHASGVLTMRSCQQIRDPGGDTGYQKFSTLKSVDGAHTISAGTRSNFYFGHSIDFDNGSILDMVAGDLDVILFDGGGTIHFGLTSNVGGIRQFILARSRSGDIPDQYIWNAESGLGVPIVSYAGGMRFLSPLNCSYYRQFDGNFDISDQGGSVGDHIWLLGGTFTPFPGKTLNINAGFLSVGVDIPAGTYQTSPGGDPDQNVARNCTINTGADWSDGTALTAMDCIDGTGTLGVNFGTPVVTLFTGATDDSLSNPSNWTNGIPDSMKIARLDVTSPDFRLDDELDCFELDFTGYAGNFNPDFNFVWVRFRDWIVSPDMSMTTGSSIMDIEIDAGAIHSNGNAFAGSYFEIDTDGKLTFADDCQFGYNINAFDNTQIDLGTTELTFNIPSSDEEGLYIFNSADLKWSSGAQIIANVESGSYFDLGTGNCDHAISPPIEQTGGQFYNHGRPTRPYSYCHLQSLTLDGGVYWNAQVGNSDSLTNVVDIEEDFTANGGVFTSDSGGTNSGDQYIIVRNDLNFSSIDILDHLRLDVRGSGEFHNATSVSNVDAIFGTEIDASDNCIDGGGNINVTFNTGNTAKIKTRGFFNEY